MKQLLPLMVALMMVWACKKDNANGKQPINPNPTDTTQTDSVNFPIDTVVGSGIAQVSWDQDHPNRHYILQEIGIMTFPTNAQIAPTQLMPRASAGYYQFDVFPQFLEENSYVITMQAPGVDQAGHNIGIPLQTLSLDGKNPDTYGYFFVEDIEGDSLETDVYLIAENSLKLANRYDTVRWSEYISHRYAWRLVFAIHGGAWKLVAAKPGALGYCTNGKPIESIVISYDPAHYADNTKSEYNRLTFPDGEWDQFTGQNRVDNTRIFTGDQTDTIRLNTMEIVSNKPINKNGTDLEIFRYSVNNIYE
ncbi:MAG: hypothetical protein RLP14_10405 [Owenweeksia sp.]